jgi:hypothetical protein
MQIPITSLTVIDTIITSIVYSLVLSAMGSSSAGSQVVGVIDGKFDSGYLVTVTIGSEKLKGVLYQAPQNPVLPASHHSVPANNNVTASVGVHRRRRRKKSEMKKRDPAHPKPNRSGYNFFFAEQHPRLKPLHRGKDREISRTIGELWNKLPESEKAVRNLFNTSFMSWFLSLVKLSIQFLNYPALTYLV